MMKKNLLFGVIFSICMIMLVNSSSAIEYKTVVDHNDFLLKSKLEFINNFIEKIRQTFDYKKTNSINLINKYKIEELSHELSELRISIINNQSITSIIRTIFGFIIGLLFSIIGTIFGIIFGPLLTLFVRIITAPAVLLAKIITFIINLLTF